MNKVFLNLGRQPLANSFLNNIKKNTIKKEFFYNLKICFNKKNYLVSVKKPVNPKKQYTDKYAIGLRYQWHLLCLPACLCCMPAVETSEV